MLQQACTGFMWTALSQSQQCLLSKFCTGKIKTNVHIEGKMGKNVYKTIISQSVTTFHNVSFTKLFYFNSYFKGSSNL